MSKTKLKKLLEHLDRDQMTQMILDLYDARPEAKDYLDFYSEPDIDSRLDKSRRSIDKEVRRKQRGYARPRVTRIKKYIKDITSLNPGAEYGLEIMTYAFEQLCAQGASPIKEATQRSTGRLMTDIITIADRNALLSDYLPRLQKAVDTVPKRLGIFQINRFKELLDDTLADSLDSIAGIKTTK